MRTFNTEGPVVPAEHYCIHPLERVDLKQILDLIRLKKYFVLHAPRQTGKTSTLLALAARLNADGEYRCLYSNVEPAQAVREDVDRANRVVLAEIADRASLMLGDDSLDALRLQILAHSPPELALRRFLARWAAAEAKPVVLLIDEIDSLVGDSLISVLRQLRAGYDLRPAQFPQSVVLCGVRDVRDYRIRSSAEKDVVAGGSAFNVKAESLRLGDFQEAEVRELLGQHTRETGQAFEEAAYARVWELTRGQPWLTNALARQACEEYPAGQDRDRPVGVGAIEDAKEALIRARATHLDQLADKLQEDRVRGIVEPVLAGSGLPDDLPVDDLDYVSDLGLVQADENVEVANPIYREIIPRQLTRIAERFIQHRTAWYVDADGNLDLVKLLEAFQAYYRENAGHWLERFAYKEAGPQLLLQAFLQRVVNHGGRIEREYALGRGRTDLLVLWPQGGTWNPTRVRKHVVECKVVRGKRSVEGTIREGLGQTAEYMEHSGAETGHLVVFDRNLQKPWAQRAFRREESAGATPITVWGM